MDPSNLPLIDDQDIEILVNRNTHFGGSFSIMLEYYKKDGIGINPNLSMKRIEEMQHIEKSVEADIGEYLLPEIEKADVQRAIETYNALKSVDEKTASTTSKNITALILTESEHPKKLIDLLSQDPAAIDPLLKIVASQDYYSPFFPGYGLTPLHAIEILGNTKNKDIIPLLFEEIGQHDFDVDESLLNALKRAPGTEEYALKFMKNISSPSLEKAAVMLISLASQKGALASLDLLSSLKSNEQNDAIFYCIFLLEFLPKDTLEHVQPLKNHLNNMFHSEIDKVFSMSTTQ